MTEDLFTAEMEEKWNLALKRLESLPDGRYVLELTGATIAMNRDGIPLVVWRWRVAEGEYRDCEFSEFSSLTGERSMEFLVQRLSSFGVDLREKTVHDLPEILTELAGLTIVGRLRNSGNFKNIGVETLLGHHRQRQGGERASSHGVTGVTVEEKKELSEPEGDPFADMEPMGEPEEWTPQAGDVVLLSDGKEATVLGYDPSARRLTVRTQGKLRSVRIEDVEGVIDVRE